MNAHHVIDTTPQDHQTEFVMVHNTKSTQPVIEGMIINIRILGEETSNKIIEKIKRFYGFPVDDEHQDLNNW